VGHLHRLAGGFAASQILVTAARFRIADRLAQHPCSAEDLAHATGAEPKALHRFLRMLVVLNVLTQTDADRFSLSPLGQPLRSDHPESLHDRLIYIGEIAYPIAQATSHAVRTGNPAFDHVFGKPYFDHFAQHPDQGAVFSRLMTQGMSERIARIVDAYDFSFAKNVVDIGGGHGTLLAAILAAAPNAVGTVFDTPAVVAEARASLAQSRVAGRIDLVGGDLFRGPLPPDGDLYVLSNIIHDWNDEAADQVLRNCRAAVRADSRLLLIEEIMPARVATAPATVANDYTMLLLTGGRQRTRSEFRRLLDATGFSLASVVRVGPEKTGMGRKENWAILECRPRRSKV
jgi:SAM-dependent methyltransferase